MEKSVKNAVFKGFPVLMESGPFGSKQYSQTTNKETNNSLSSFFKEIYLVSKCMSKRVADQSAIGLPMTQQEIFWRSIYDSAVCLDPQPHMKGW